MVLWSLFQICCLICLIYTQLAVSYLFGSDFNFEPNKSLSEYHFGLLASKRESSSKFHREEKEKLNEDFKRVLETAKSLNLSEKDLKEYAEKHIKEESLKKKFYYLVKPKKVEKVLPKRLKKHELILPKKNVEYSIDEAISRLKIISGTKFVEGIDVTLRIPLTTKKTKSTAGQYAKLITVPYKSIKSKRTKLGIFGIKETLEEIKNKEINNLVFIGGEELIKEFKEKSQIPEVDLVLSDIQTYPKLSLLGKLLSKKKLMPNIQIGTCVETKTDLLEIVDNFVNKNLIVLKSDKVGDIKCNFADVSMPLDEIRSNLMEIFRYLKKNKPPYSSQKFINKIYISSSMGPSFKLGLKQFKYNRN